MKYKIGKQYELDDCFKRAARLHQSKFRRDILSVNFNEYGNRLLDIDANRLLNYYDHLGVRSSLRERYPKFFKKRDADMLRSEHIPFNLFGPLKNNFRLAKSIVSAAIEIEIETVTKIEFEYAPQPKEKFLNDGTAFDTYVEYKSYNGNVCGIGIEVKYTEKSYKIKKSEIINVENLNSRYWTLTRDSGMYVDSTQRNLVFDDMRQIWRNHLLGISMIARRVVDEFTSVIVYPSGNEHFQKAIPEYKALLTNSNKGKLRGCTFERYIESIDCADEKIKVWKNYLNKRYIVKQEA